MTLNISHACTSRHNLLSCVPRDIASYHVRNGVPISWQPSINMTARHLIHTKKAGLPFQATRLSTLADPQLSAPTLQWVWLFLNHVLFYPMIFYRKTVAIFVLVKQYFLRVDKYNKTFTRLIGTKKFWSPDHHSCSALSFISNWLKIVKNSDTPFWVFFWIALFQVVLGVFGVSENFTPFFSIAWKNPGIVYYQVDIGLARSVKKTDTAYSISQN